MGVMGLLPELCPSQFPHAIPHSTIDDHVACQPVPVLMVSQPRHGSPRLKAFTAFTLPVPEVPAAAEAVRRLGDSGKNIQNTIKELKNGLKGWDALGGAPISKPLRPGIQTLLDESGDQNALGDSVKNFSVSLKELVETVNRDLKKSRIALMTTQDIPQVLDDTVVKMNLVNQWATHLRSKLAAMSELSTLLLNRANVAGHARLDVGCAAPVDTAAENMYADKLKHDYDRAQEVPANPNYEAEEDYDADQVRLVYEMVDKTVRGKTANTPNINSSLRNQIAQAVVDTLHKQKQSGVEGALGPQLNGESQTASSSSRSMSNAPIDVGDHRGDSIAATVQKVLDEMSSEQTMRENRESTALLGFGDPVLAPALGASIASVLGAVNTAGPVVASASRQPRQKSSQQQRHMFLSSAGARPNIHQVMQQKRTAAMDFF